MPASSTIVNTVVRNTMWMIGGHYDLEDVATHLPELSEGHRVQHQVFRLLKACLANTMSTCICSE